LDQSSNSNAFLGINNNTDWTFVTADLAAPTVDTYSPADGTLDVDVDASFTLTFNKAVQAATGDIVIYNGSGSVLSSVVKFQSVVSRRPAKLLELLDASVITPSAIKT